jgi:predicted DNA-binding transcriptional regulator AlpA
MGANRTCAQGTFALGSKGVDGHRRPGESRETRELTAPGPSFIPLRVLTMNMTTTKSDFLTDAGLADLLHVSVRTLQRWVKDPGFPRPLQLGRCRRWDRRDVLGYLRRRTAATKTTIDDKGAV